MTGFSVITAQLRATAAEVGHISEEAQSGVASLRADVEGLLDGGWAGYAASGFAAGWQEWVTGADEVLAALSMMTQLLNTTAQGYEDHEAAADSAITSAGGPLL